MGSSVTFDLFARDHASGAFTKVGQAAEGAGKKVHGLGSAFGAVTAGSRGLHTTFGLIGKGAALAAGAAGLGGLIEGFKGVYAEAREAQKTGAQTAAVIKSTGGVAKVSADQVGALASAISNKVGVDDEAIQSGANLLLTFTKVRNEAGKGNNVFDQATSTVTDMAAAMNNGAVTTDGLKSASIQVGKALNDPLKGITALTKVGVTFDDGQKKQIATLIKHHDTLGAQKIILGELNKEFGGSAAAGTTAGQKLGVVFGNIKETIGTALLPTIDRAATWLAKVLPGALQKVSDIAGPIFTTLGRGFSGLAAAFSGEGVTSNGFVGAMETIGDRGRVVVGFIQKTIIPGVQALGAAFSGEGVTSDGFVGVMEHIGVAARAVAGFITTRVVPALRVFGGFVVGTVLPAVGRFAEFIGPIVGRALAAFGRFVTGTAIPALRQFGGFITGTVVPAAQRLWGFLAKNLGPTFSALGTLIITRIWPALQGLFVRFQQVWPTVQTLLIVLGRLALIILKVTGVILGLAIIILGRVLPVLIRLAGPVLTLLFAAIGKVIGVVAALVRVVANAAARIVSNFLAMAGGVINAAAKAFGWVPGLGPKLKGAAAEFNRFRDRVNASLSGVKSRKVTVTAALIASQAAARTQGGTSGSGGRNIRLAAGGPVSGAGSATSDSIPAMLSNGEHVLTAKEVRGLGGHAMVEAIRQQARGFAAGGPVGLDVRPQLDGLARFNAQIGAFNTRVDAMARKLAAAQAVAGGATGRAPGAVGGNAKLGQALAAQLYGWTGGQWSALFNLWQGESGWNNNAQNPTSTAYGIAQFLNSTWGGVGASKTSDPRGQIVAGLRYISQSYGTPANAYGKWLSRSPHWYGSGGVIREPVMGVGMRSGSTYGFGERGPETVTPGVGGPGAVHIHIHGAVGDKQAVIGWVQQGLREAQRKAGKPVTV